MKAIRKLITVMCCVAVFAASFGIFGQGAALAVSDVDFTINVDTDAQYIQEDTINVDIEIKTQTENGYVEIGMFLAYDTDALACATILDNVDGFTTSEVNTGAETGLNIDYVSPDGARSSIDTKVLKLQLVVRTGVASDGYALSLKVNRVAGLTAEGNKEDGLLTVSNAKDKTLTIQETSGSSGTEGETGEDPNYYFTTTTTPQEVQGGGSGKTSAGTVILFIVGAIVLFGAGLVVGFIVCQNRIYGEQGGRPSYGGSAGGLGDQTSFSRKRGFASSLGAGFADSAKSGKRSGSIYDDDEPTKPEDEPYASPSAQSRNFTDRARTQLDDDPDSYFGNAGSKHIGSVSSVYDDDSDDDYLPRKGIGKNSEDYAGYGTALGGKARERDDDGYGGFSGSRSSRYDDGYNSGARVDSYFGGSAQSKPTPDEDLYSGARGPAKFFDRPGRGAADIGKSNPVDGYFGSSPESAHVIGNTGRFTPPASVTGFSGDDDDDKPTIEPPRSSDRRRYR